MQQSDVVIAAGTLWSIRHGRIKRCQVCHAKSSPCWRRSESHTQLCNRCGIRARVARNRRANGKAKGKRFLDPLAGVEDASSERNEG